MINEANPAVLSGIRRSVLGAPPQPHGHKMLLCRLINKKFD